MSLAAGYVTLMPPNVTCPCLIPITVTVGMMGIPFIGNYAGLYQHYVSWHSLSCWLYCS